MKLGLARLMMLVILTLTMNLAVAAPSPSPAMAAQLKKLPKSEQLKIAKQYGFNLDDLDKKLDSASAETDEESAEAQPLTPDDRIELKEKEREKELKEKEDKNKPTRYGLNLFDASISTFAPVGNVPVPDSYVLAGDDELLLQFYGKENNEEKLKIARDGSIVVPDVGALQVGGLTFAKAKALISERVRQQKIGVDVAVSMGTLRTISVFVAGEGKFPGSYSVSALSTVTQVLFVAGGISDIGSLREISVKRAGVEVARFDMYELLLRGDSSNDIHLKHGDVIFVAPVKRLAEVAGEVQRPAIYEVKDGETIADLVSMSGGSKAGAYPRKVVIERFNAENVRTLLNIDLTKVADQKVQIANGDIVRIGQTSKRVEHVVTIAGAVVRPGQYAWSNGLRVNQLLSSLWSDLHLTVDLDYALVVREANQTGEVKVLQFNLGEAITNPASRDNLELSPRDLILVFHHADQSYMRSELDQLLYEKLLKQYPEKKLFAKTDPVLDDKLPQPFKVDVAALTNQAFAALTEKEKPKETRPGVVPEREPVQQNAEHKAYLKAQLKDILDNIYYDPAVLKLSSHLTREELLYPLMQKLRLQARFNAKTQIISVYGEVKHPGEYPLPEQGDVAQLLTAAGGLNDSAYLEKAELSRLLEQNNEQSGLRVQHKNINLIDVLQGTDTVKLQSRDRLNVFAVPDWNVERTIEISGQVRFPGTYTIQQGEKLSSVLARAGGLTKDGFARGAVFTRKAIREQETAQLAKLMQQLRSDMAAKSLSSQASNGMVSTSKPEDAIMMIAEIEKAKPVGRLVIDIEAVLAADPEFDLLVEEGDELYVPTLQTTVAVVGEVQHASSHRFKQGMSVDDYLRLAGGFRKRADDDRVYVIRADGSVFIPATNSWFAVSQSSLLPGDTIVVPLDTDYNTNLSLWTQVTSIISQSVVALAAINNLNN